MGGHVYIMCNINNTTLYTGVSANLPARVVQHKDKEHPKSFTAKYNCVKLSVLTGVSSILVTNNKKYDLSIKYKKISVMKATTEHNERIAKLLFGSVYPHYLEKVKKKGRTPEELQQVITWLTGFNKKKTEALIKEKVTFEEFFNQAKINPNAHLITGLICGYRVEEIENPLTQQVRYLDKLVDELARGKKMESILRGS